MHTFVTLANLDDHWFAEREVSGLISALRNCCDSIDSCDVSVEGPSGIGEAHCWQVELQIRVLGEIVRIAMRAPEGSDPQQALASLLADIYARATTQLAHISAQHGGCALCA